MSSIIQTLSQEKKMSLIPCPSCSAQISPAAVTCPQCGHPVTTVQPRKKKRSKIKIIGLIVVGLIIIGAVASQQKKDGRSPSSTSQSTSGGAGTGDTVHEIAARPGIGDIVTFDDSEWVVLEAVNLGQRLRSNNQFQEDARTTGAFVRVHFRVTNRTNEEQRIFDAPKLVDDQGREFEGLDFQSFYIPEDGETIGFTALPADIPREFYSIFEVPADAAGLQFQTRSFATVRRSYVAVDLGLAP